MDSLTPESRRGGWLHGFARILIGHWVLVASLITVCTGGTWLYCRFVAEHHYRSRVSLVFKRPARLIPVGSAGAANEAVPDSFIRDQRQIVTSDLVLSRAQVISKDQSLREQWKSLRDGIRSSGEGSKSESQERVERFLNGTIGDRVHAMLSDHQGEFDRFRSGISVEMPGGDPTAMSDSITLCVDRPAIRGDAAPNLIATEAAEILADMYIVRFSELQRELSEPAVRVMDDVLADYEKHVAEKSREYEKFVQENPGDVGVLEQLIKSGSEHGVQAMLTEVRETDAKLNLELSRDKAVRDVLLKAIPAEALEPGGADTLSADVVRTAVERMPAEFVQANVTIHELQKLLAKLAARRAGLETQFTAESRELRNITEEIARTYRSMLSEIIARTRSLSSSIEARDQQIAMNREILEKGEREQNEIHRKLVAYARLKNDFQVAQKHLEDLRKQQADAVSATLQARQAVTISRLNPASIPNPDDPASPRTTFLTLMALGASLFTSLILAYLLDNFDQTLRSPTEAERYLGVPVLGSIRKRSNGLVMSA